MILKVDMSNAFNLVSRLAVLEECATFSPELLPWVTWCYGSNTSLFHPQGRIWSQSGIHQGDPLGPMLFALVLHKLVSSIEADDECLNISQQNWYLDDGVIAGDRQAVAHALDLMMELGPHLGLHTNLHKCELLSRNGNSFFPTSVKFSLYPNMIILGSPLGDLIHCTRFAERCTESKNLLGAITEVAVHVAFSLLRLCASFCKHVHLSRTTPPSICSVSLKLFDEDVRSCLTVLHAWLWTSLIPTGHRLSSAPTWEV